MPAITSYGVASATATEFIRLAHGNSAVYASNYGVVADDTTDDTAALQAAFDAAFGPVGAPKAREDYRTLILPQGIIKITSPVYVSEGLFGGVVLGQGRFATQIRQNTTGDPALVTNACQYSYFANFLIRTEGGICFDLNHDGSFPNSANLQSNMFQNIFFDAGDKTATNSCGVRIGAGGFMGSENMFVDCFWIRCKYGINTLNFNALQNTVIGGNMQDCAWGIFAGSGSVTLIDSVGFQLSSEYDIEASASAYDTMVINACRTESPNFVKTGSQGAVLTGCTQNSVSTAGYFAHADSGIIKLIGCQVNGPSSFGGKVKMGNGGSIDSSYWRNPDLDILDPVGAPVVITFENLSLNTSEYLAKGWMVGKYIHSTDIPNGTVRWNYSDKEEYVALYGDDYVMVQLPKTGNSCVRANTSKSSGKWYWEVYIHFHSTGSEGPGVANASHTLTNALGGDTNGISIRNDGLYYNNALVVSMTGLTTGVRVRFALDKDNNKLWVAVNAGNWNGSGSDNPATNTGGYSISVSGALYPTAYIGEDYGSQVLIPQARRWAYSAPSGFSELT